jgi:hypothetical protein
VLLRLVSYYRNIILLATSFPLLFRVGSETNSRVEAEGKGSLKFPIRLPMDLFTTLLFEEDPFQLYIYCYTF